MNLREEGKADLRNASVEQPIFSAIDSIAGPPRLVLRLLLEHEPHGALSQLGGVLASSHLLHPLDVWSLREIRPVQPDRSYSCMHHLRRWR